MLVIRFFRQGKKNQPSFKIVVTDKRKSSTGGRFVEEVGFYNPITKEKNLKAERIKYWISVGAKPLETVHNLLVSEKIIEGKKIKIYRRLKQLKEEVPKAPASEKPADVSTDSAFVAEATSAKEAATAKVGAPKESSSAPASAKATAGEKATADKEVKKGEPLKTE